MAGMGYGRGGFAQGLSAGVSAGRGMMEGYDWGRKRAAEEEAGAAYGAQPEETTNFDYNEGAQKKYKLGNQYQDQPYSPEQLSDYRTNAAADAYSKYGQIDKAVGLRKSATQDKLAQTQLAGAQRNERYGHLAETSMALIRRVHGGEDPLKVYQEAAQHFNQVNDGKTAGLSDDGQHLVINDATTGQAKVVPATPENAIKAITALHSLSSPQAFEKEQDQQLKSRQVGAQERTAAATELGARTNEGLRKSHERLYGAMADWYRSGGADRRGSGGQSGLERLPEGDKIMLTNLERQEQSIQTLIGKTEDPAQRSQLAMQLRKIRGDQFHYLDKHQLLPEGTTRTQYMGLPDPLESARRAMVGATDENTFRQSMEQFDQLYGDAPEAAQARDAMQLFMQQKFYDRPQQAGGGMLTGDNHAYNAGQAARGAGEAGLSAAGGLMSKNPVFAAPRYMGAAILGAPEFARGLTMPRQRQQQ